MTSRLHPEREVTARPTLPDAVDVDGVTWRVTRAWPRTLDEVPFELADPAGARVAARWFADEAVADQAESRTPGVRRVGRHVVVHERGADRKLPTLAGRLVDGAELLVHRPERRAVLRTAGGFVKLVRTGRAEQLAEAHRRLAWATADHADVPTVVSTHPDGVTLDVLPGRSLTDLGADAAVADAEVAAAWHRLGQVVAALGRSTAAGLPVHDAATEAEVTATAVERAVAARRLPPARITPLLEAFVDAATPAAAVAHRDLHDGQVLVHGSRLGLLDPDTLAAAEPALDLANLLVHLDLRNAQGLLSTARRRAAADALLRGADPSGAVLARVPAHAQVARLRLCAVYSWRPAHRDLARRWWSDLTG